MAEKARDAFRTISEVANWLDIPAHVLRFWESKFSQIKPVKRAGGRRYYRPADMQFIGGIKTLLHDNGMTIRGVQKMIKEDGVKKIAAMSPPLDMPSEEEGAARRAARRARRQARQAAKSNPVVEAKAVEAATVEAEAAEPEALVAETVETAKPETAEAEAVKAEAASQDAVEAENITEAEAAAAQEVEAPQETETFAEPSVEEELPLASEPPAEMFPDTGPAQVELAEDPAPLILEHPEQQASVEEAPFEHVEELAAEPDNVVPMGASDVVPDAEELPLEDSAEVAAVETQTELAVEEPSAPETAAPSAPPAQIDIPDDPDPSTIKLTEAQVMQVARLKNIRRIDVSTELMGGSDAAVASGLTRLRALRDRVAASLDGS